ncbi:PD-(D/E)XK nuclease family protein [Undibacterium sp. TS12]|uniref:PD-(D/E)XK nuclease family protein n=1 Tax=Undibacterium sp. TS12 TaxID=2908202 RepID=UPI001F4D16D4|nr:PD-(D/E)XK nuclease family protein [Undibacterium sp. TS12]MCH8619752.1 PD-(D/E)XK nuclease family protein [Undibacterium sp. TS12]
MLHPPQLIPASPAFWRHAAQVFLRTAEEQAWGRELGRDFSGVRVIVPTYQHAHLLLRALGTVLQGNFIPPRTQTVFALLEMLSPDAALQKKSQSSDSSERLMNLYGELRQHAWLKKLFGARRNTDLLPLAQTLLTLSDELTAALLPTVGKDRSKLEKDWQAALAQLPAPAQALLSEESQLVWTVWQSQLDGNDPQVRRYAQLLQVAAQASEPLLWIAPTMPNVMEQVFLKAWAKKQTVMQISLDWRAQALPQPYYHAWPGLQDSGAQYQQALTESVDTSHIRLCRASSLEEEAVQGAQTIINWLQAGKQSVAVVAQDRVVSRRIRALLERAQIMVADETGWKLSTTRAAAAVAAWLEVVTTRADTMALLDFLKSPYLVWKDNEDTAQDSVTAKADLVMHIELILRRANVLGGWESVLAALDAGKDAERASRWLRGMARLAASFSGRRSLSEWSAQTLQLFFDLSMFNAFQADQAGAQIIQLLQKLQIACADLQTGFSFAEWRALINLQLESTAFTFAHTDKRVVMLPLNGARLRPFDAVLLVGADASHLPSQASEVLFFANAVRRECGLETRELRQQQQLRDLAELLLSNSEIVLSWQGSLNGEHNPVSPWLEQLGLTLERTQQNGLDSRPLELPVQTMRPCAQDMPAPSAAVLLPETLSASGYTSLVVCPYQFFAGRMLGLSGLDELSDMPEKRDYGDWLHAILKCYHEELKTAQLHELDVDKESLLRKISADFFVDVLQKSPATLAYSVRWEKVIPAYIAWQQSHEEAGWQFDMGEIKNEKLLTWPGGQLTLKGRIDRIDKHVSGEMAVLDYKTKNLMDLRTRLKQGEDHQLPFYGLLTDLPVSSGSYVALELSQGKAGQADADDFERWVSELALSIKTSMSALQQGAPMPAHGVENTCQYCEMRGLCRKGAWL